MSRSERANERTERWNRRKLVLRTNQARCQARALRADMSDDTGRCTQMGQMLAGEHLCYVHGLMRSEGRAKLAVES